MTPTVSIKPLWPIVAILCVAISACSNHDAPAETPETQPRAFLAGRAIPLERPGDLDPLFEAIGLRRFVLLGESTHGTHEYYRWRDIIARRLIASEGFRFVAVEGDWQAISRLNDYVKHRTPAGDVRTTMRTLDRWPQWLWANEEFARFLEWLHAHNASLPPAERVGVFGVDMQDPLDSMRAVKQWVERHEPDHLEAIRRRYQRVYEHPGGFQAYARGLAQGQPRGQQDFRDVVEWLRQRSAETPDDKALWMAKRNAMAVQYAEAQYFAMLHRGPESWNVRARAMHETFLRLANWHGETSRGMLWAHNTHVGDASATDMANRGEVNIGQLLRRDAGADQVFILGFATDRGTVIAGERWGAPMRVMTVIPASETSVEALLRDAGARQALYLFSPSDRDSEGFPRMPQRAIGVVYNPPHEAYVDTLLTQRYDAVIYFDETRALTPLPE